MNPAPIPFEQSLFIAVPAARVWEAIVSPEDVANYHLCPLERIDRRIGGDIAYGADGQVFISGTIVELVPGQRLVHTFRFMPARHENVASDRVSRVAYAITPMGRMCKLVLTHDGFETKDQSYANIVGGWPTILSGLKTWLETGKPLPWPEAAQP